ncbi:MAG: hypothetical protein CVV13_08875 [Gammaproteobacteria bacterium HGW-Gammaproteobacteria-3]|nr:MAG: hypothetical protein CVV13_08875 [Gammaproteobacteria bacterium HGW-Gammaproteobacteria-3]
MTEPKRGLNRGLEALLKIGSAELHQMLANTSPALAAEPDSPLSIAARADDFKTAAPGAEGGAQSALILALFEHIRKENLMLLEEAEALKRLLDEFEQVVGRL